MAIIYLKKVKVDTDLCFSHKINDLDRIVCHFYKNRQKGACEKYCIPNILYKQVYFERVEDLCGNCYFYLSKPPYCSFPEDKYESDCAKNNLIYKKIIHCPPIENMRGTNYGIDPKFAIIIKLMKIIEGDK